MSVFMLLSVLPRLIRAVRNQFCSGPGQATNLTHFYIFVRLYGVNLSFFNYTIENGVDGNGYGYDNGSSEDEHSSQNKKKKVSKDEKRISLVAQVLGKTMGLGTKVNTGHGRGRVRAEAEGSQGD